MPWIVVKRNRWAIAGISVLVLAVVSVFAYAVPAEAQGAQTANILKVSPVRTDIEVLPGGREVVQATITNLADAPVTVRPVANDFIAGDERGTPALILDETQYAPTHSLKRFMSPLSPVTIEPNESKTINVVITVPRDAQAGGYFGSVRFMPSDPDKGGQVNLSPSVASLVLLKVPGAVVEDLRVKTFEIQKAGAAGMYFKDPGNLQVVTRFENKGNVQVAPRGKIQVCQGESVVYEADFNTSTPPDMILPDSIRRWEIPLKDVGAIGVFTVAATLTYGDKNQTMEIQQTFWVVPFWVVLTALGVLVTILGLVILFVVLSMRRRTRHGRQAPRKKKRGIATQPNRRFGR